MPKREGRHTFIKILSYMRTPPPPSSPVPEYIDDPFAHHPSLGDWNRPARIPTPPPRQESRTFFSRISDLFDSKTKSAARHPYRTSDAPLDQNLVPREVTIGGKRVAYTEEPTTPPRRPVSPRVKTAAKWAIYLGVCAAALGWTYLKHEEKNAKIAAEAPSDLKNFQAALVTVCHLERPDQLPKDCKTETFVAFYDPRVLPQDQSIIQAVTNPNMCYPNVFMDSKTLKPLVVPPPKDGVPRLGMDSTDTEQGYRVRLRNEKGQVINLVVSTPAKLDPATGGYIPIDKAAEAAYQQALAAYHMPAYQPGKAILPNSKGLHAVPFERVKGVLKQRCLVEKNRDLTPMPAPPSTPPANQPSKPGRRK